MPFDPGIPLPRIAAGALLSLMAVLMFSSVWSDSPTSDDNVALIAGYSYLRMGEYRLEPQNPPLIKDLAALPLLWMNLNDPWDHKSWREDVDDPDTLGRVFLYHSGNDPDRILRAARAPMILLTLAFGCFLFWWTEHHYGPYVALLTLTLFVFSPTFLAHGRLVATDIGATAGFFVAMTALLRFLKAPTRRNVVLAGVAFGFAFLTKFSTVALIPIAPFLGVAWAFAHRDAAHSAFITWRTSASDALTLSFRGPDPARLRAMARYASLTILIIAIGYVVVYPLYLHHVWNYDPGRQAAEAGFHRTLYDLHGTARDLVLWSADKPLLRPLSQYFLGLLVALKASRMGQPMFFLGQSFSTGIRSYFPMVYLIKEPLATHLLLILSLTVALAGFRKHTFTRRFLREHFTEFAFLTVIVVVWIALIRSNMNIGERHLLPTFPFVFILVSAQIVSLAKRAAVYAPAQKLFGAGLVALILWQAVSVISVHPSYLAYFNELVGGPNGGWQYVNDSNLDWGQDVKRLGRFVEERGITEIHAEVFGPADLGYYLQDAYRGGIPCDASPPKGWLAISAMLYPGAPWNASCDYRRWLPPEKIVAKIGHSIFIFKND